MISSELTNSRIDGMEWLFKVFPRDYSFSGAYLKGLLLHDNGDVQLTYSIKTEKTYIIVFIMSGCEDLTKFRVTAKKTNIEGIDISANHDDTLRFVDKSNELDIVCHGLKITTNVILSKTFAKEQAQILTKHYSDILQQKFDSLEMLYLDDNKPLFRRDDSYNGIHANHHTMYKLDDLHNKDNSITYEFLIEFDRNDPCLGIYFGCKGLIKKGDNLEQQKAMIIEWNEHIMSKVLERLDKLYVGKRFDNRFKPTDNANDNTFWPFWISLYEDENILEVAVRTTIIIRDEYKRFIEGPNYEPDKTCKYCLTGIVIDKKYETHSETRFTTESWEALNKPWKVEENATINKKRYISKTNEEWAALLGKFITGAIREGQLTSNVDRYEKAYMFEGSATYFSLMLELLVNRMQDERKVPWTLICKQFLDKDGNIYSEDVLKNSGKRFLKTRHPDYSKLKDHESKMKWEKEKKDDFVVLFKRIMN